MTDIPWIVSLDDHVVEPPDVWTKRLPAKYRDIGPHVVMAPAGTPVLDGGGYRESARHRRPRRRVVVLRGPAVLGEAPHRRRGLSRRGDRLRRASRSTRCARVLAAAGAPRRHDDEPRRGVAGVPELPALLRPDLPEGEGQGAGAALRRGVQRLAGRGMVRRAATAASSRCASSRCGTSSSRRRRCAATRRAACGRSRSRSCRRGSGCPSIHSGYWDPFFAACAETGTVVAMHIGSGTKTITSSDDAPDAVQAVNMFANSALSLIDFLFSGVLVRFPDLKLLYAEAQIGWIPYVLERVDDVWDVHRGWSDSQRNVTEPPSQYYYRQVAELLLQGRRRASRTSTGSGARTSRSRPTIRTRTAPGPTRIRSPRSSSASSTPTRCTRSCAATPSASSASSSSATAAVRAPRDHARSGRDDRRRRGCAPRPPRAACSTRSACPTLRPRVVADNLVEADLRGVDSHGSHLMALYHRPRPRRPPPTGDRGDARSTTDGSTVRLDAGLGFGQIARRRRRRPRDRTGAASTAWRRCRSASSPTSARSPTTRCGRRPRGASRWRSRTAP